MGITGRFHAGMEGEGIWCILMTVDSLGRRQVSTTAKPVLCGHNITRIHMNGRNTRVSLMRNKGNTCRPKAWVFIRAGNIGRHIGRKFTFDHRNMHTAFFEETPAQHAACATPAVFNLAFPVFINKLTWVSRVKVFRGLAFQSFKFRADIIAQGFEPSGGTGFSSLEISHSRALGQALGLPQGLIKRYGDRGSQIKRPRTGGDRNNDASLGPSVHIIRDARTFTSK